MRTITRILTTLLAAIGLLIPFTAIPVGLVLLVGWPLPDHWPTTRDWIAWGTSTNLLTDHGLIDLFACALWLVWAFLAYLIVRETLHALRQLRLPHPRIPVHRQGLVGSLIGMLVLGASRMIAMLHTGAGDPVLASNAASTPAMPAVEGLDTPNSVAATNRVASAATPINSHAGEATSSDLSADTTAYTARGPLDGLRWATAGAVDTASAPADASTYAVVDGDTLWGIAGAQLGDPTRWPEIYALNHGLPQPDGYALHDPDAINIGWVLRLPPPPASLSAPPRHAPSQHTPPRAPLSPSHAPSASSPSDPAPSGPAPSGPASSPLAPSDSTSTPAARSPSAARPAGRASGVRLPGVGVPGGWIPVGMAAAVVAAAGMVWLRRRHRYQPTPVTQPVLDDPDLSPPLATLARLRRAVGRYAPQLLDRTPEAGPTVREYNAVHDKPPAQPVGPNGSDLAGIGSVPVPAGLIPAGLTSGGLMSDGLIPAGLGMAGPGAVDAARALLVATLSSGHPNDPDAQGQVVVPAATLNTLLGASAIDLPPLRRLTVSSSLADALAGVEAEIIRRHRVLADYDTPDIAALRAAQPLAEPLPPLLFLVDAPDDGRHARLSTAIRLGAAVEISTVLIGAWSDGATLTVAADGTASVTGDGTDNIGDDDGTDYDATDHDRTDHDRTDHDRTDHDRTDHDRTDHDRTDHDCTKHGDSQRVAVLDPAAANDILAMLREAHGDTAPPGTTNRPIHGSPTPSTPDASGTSQPSTLHEAANLPSPAPTTSTHTTPSDKEPGAATRVRLRVLGSPAVLDPNGTPMPDLRSKSLELLVYLAVHRRGASLDDIMEAIFGEVTQRRAPQHLSTCVANLRGAIRKAADLATAIGSPEQHADRAAGHEKSEGGPSINPIVNTGGHYHLDPSLVSVDWWTVLDAYALIATTDKDTDRLAHLQAAIAATGGGLADGRKYDWIDTDREYVRRHLIKIYAHAAALLADSDAHQAHVYRDAACNLDPLSDELARRAMRAAARLGNADAINGRLAQLRRELNNAGLDLDPATEQLAADLLRDLASP